MPNQIMVEREDLKLLINTAIHMRTEIAREQELTLFPILRTLASERIAELTAIIEKADKALHPDLHQDLYVAAADGYHGIRISSQ